MNYAKIAPGLAIAYDAFQDTGARGLDSLRHLMGLVAEADSPKPARAVVFLHADPAADLSHLARERIRVNQAQGHLRTAFLPLAGLPRLAAEPAVERVLPSSYLRLAMDLAPARVGLPAFRQATGASGKGIVIGIVDTGIDPNHPAFAGRILRIWDQVLPGPGVAEGAYGVELDGARLSVSRDHHGHGTHVAGIAAGADPSFGGVAPGAELIVVKTDLQDAHIADGLRYIFRVARQLGRPAVVNLSLGGHYDPHDGSDPLSMIVDELSGPGRIVCCAAGNDGDRAWHARLAVPAGRSRSASLSLRAGSFAPVLVNLWYSGDAPCELAIRGPQPPATPYQAVIAEGDPWRGYDLPGARVRLATGGRDPDNGDHNVLVLLEPLGGAPLPAGRWQIKLRNRSGRDALAHAWLAEGGEGAHFSGAATQDGFKIGSPGAAAAAITVAASVSRARWTDIEGRDQRVDLALDRVASFSSEGPRRDGRPKPDLAAPGAMIASALSADAPQDRGLTLAPRFGLGAGTSMATPFVAGLVALLLEREPGLEPAAAKEALRRQLRPSASGAHDPKSGWGLLDLDASRLDPLARPPDA